MNLSPCIIVAGFLKGHFIKTNEESCMEPQIKHLISIV